jgi:ribosomal-protein-alanine N-acetyltransferase
MQNNRIPQPPQERASAVFKDMYIETERLVIRPFTMDDLHDLHAIVSQGEVMEYLPDDPMTLTETERTLSWIIDSYDRNRPRKIIKYTVAVIFKESGELIGWCGLGPLDFDPSQIELYYGLRKQPWGGGVATEAARALAEYGFHTVSLDRIVGVVPPANVASKRVLEKIGMIYRMRVAGLPPDHSAYEGLLYFSLTAEQIDR